MSHFLGMDLEQLATRKSFFLFMRYNNLLNGPLLLALSGRTPSYFAKQAFAQYELGLSFVEKKLDDGGMDELSRAYVRLPGENTIKADVSGEYWLEEQEVAGSFHLGKGRTPGP